MSIESGALTGKAALITGASRGIGRAIAERLALEGASVIVNYCRNEVEAKVVVESIRESGGIAEAVRADLSVPGQISPMFDRAEELLGPLDIFVNNAGVAIIGPFAEFLADDYDRIFQLNTRGAFLCLQQAAKRIREGGRIVNISSGATMVSPAGYAVYAASKAALEQFSRTLAREIAGRGVTVNVVSPGFTQTDMLAQAPEAMKRAPSMTPLGRLGQPGDIADVVLFLCSSQGGWMTGQNLQASGGLNMT